MRRMKSASSRALLAAIAVMLLASPALSDVSAADRSAAQGLFDQGRDLMTKGDFAHACPMLEESQRIDPGQGTQFNLAKCYEGLGRTTTAQEQTFLDGGGFAG